MTTLTEIILRTWGMLLQSGPYILFGITVAGLLKVFLDPATVARHLAVGRYAPVFKAALIGIPLPLCSCGVLPAAATLKKQGANRGALTSFLISTPESSIDSIAVTLALLDPLITIARPVAAFITAFAAGITVNCIDQGKEDAVSGTLKTACSRGGKCCSNATTASRKVTTASGLCNRLAHGAVYAVREVWSDIAAWFFLGLLIAGIISVLIPSELMTQYLGGGIFSMLTMLGAGIPLYICATASTPVAAALVLKGASPGAALVLMLAGPATNITSLSVLLGILGSRVTAVYLLFIAVFSVAAGMTLDLLYMTMGISASAIVGDAGEFLPHWLQVACSVLLLTMSLSLFLTRIRKNRQAMN